ncbi:MAG: chordopoxvirus fusion protein, partial [Caldimicrobium sp.]
WIIGEAKTQLKKKDVETFLRRREIFERLFPGKKVYLLVTYMDVGDAEEYARKKNIKVYYSYQFPL